MRHSLLLVLSYKCCFFVAMERSHKFSKRFTSNIHNLEKLITEKDIYDEQQLWCSIDHSRNYKGHNRSSSEINTWKRTTDFTFRSLQYTNHTILKWRIWKASTKTKPRVRSTGCLTTCNATTWLLTIAWLMKCYLILNNIFYSKYSHK